MFDRRHFHHLHTSRLVKAQDAAFKHALNMVSLNSVAQKSCLYSPRPLLHPASRSRRGAGQVISLAHGLDRHHREDAKQDEDRRKNVQERITMRQSKDEAGQHRRH